MRADPKVRAFEPISGEATHEGNLLAKEMEAATLGEGDGGWVVGRGG